MSKPLILATRKSPLAMAQTRAVFAALQKKGIACEIKTFSTTGDEITDRPLAEIGGKELFLNTLRRALREGAADIAVHSAKDMPAKHNEEFAAVVIGFSEDPRDVFISQKYNGLQCMPPGATIGTCSPRRAALLAEYFPQIKIAPMRGNVGSRLQKLKDGACGGMILAAAGLRRLNLISGAADFSGLENSEMLENADNLQPAEVLTDAETGKIKENGGNGFGGFNFQYLTPEIFIPAPGQGVIVAECLADNIANNHLMGKIRAAFLEERTALRLRAETAFAAAMGGDCHTPLGAFATITAETIALRAFYAGGGRFCKTFVRRAPPDFAAASDAANIAAAEVLK